MCRCVLLLLHITFAYYHTRLWENKSSTRFGRQDIQKPRNNDEFYLFAAFDLHFRSELWALGCHKYFSSSQCPECGNREIEIEILFSVATCRPHSWRMEFTASKRYSMVEISDQRGEKRRMCAFFAWTEKRNIYSWTMHVPRVTRIQPTLIDLEWSEGSSLNSFHSKMGHDEIRLAHKSACARISHTVTQSNLSTAQMQWFSSIHMNTGTWSPISRTMVDPR